MSFADKHKLKVDSLDDYLRLLDGLFQERKQAGAVCLKSTLAYQRTLYFDNVPRAGRSGLRQGARRPQSLPDPGVPGLHHVADRRTRRQV